MPSFGRRSRERLETLHPELQKVLEIAIVDGPDFSIICGHRDEAAQNLAYKVGNSKKQFPDSKHNRNPSWAVDICPYGGRDVWGDHIRFAMIAGYLLRIGEEVLPEGLALRWGGDWSRTWRARTSNFFDGGHVELVEE